MKTIEKIVVGLSLTLLTGSCFGITPQTELSIRTKLDDSFNDSNLVSEEKINAIGETDQDERNFDVGFTDDFLSKNSSKEIKLLNFSSPRLNQSKLNFGLSSQADEPFFKNRRNVYSGMWAFASLNYLYADLVGVMDKNKLVQYQTGVVEGVKITPKFLTVAAGFMQIPIANVFLPHVIKNEKTLRWVQIASGSIMTLVQAGTLFVGKPTPYYALFSAFEIAATTYITIDAIKWKPNSSKKKAILD